MKLVAQLIEVVGRSPGGDGAGAHAGCATIFDKGGFQFLAPGRERGGHGIQLAGYLLAVGEFDAAFGVFEREDGGCNGQQRLNFLPLRGGQGEIVFLAGKVVGQQQIVGLAFLVEGRKVDRGQLLSPGCMEAAHAIARGWRQRVCVDAGQRIVVGGVALDERLHGIRSIRLDGGRRICRRGLEERRESAEEETIEDAG